MALGLSKGLEREATMDITDEIRKQEELGQEHWVRCPHCAKAHDATRSLWCNCLTDNPTVVCPHCHRCFCGEDPSARVRFWQLAPPAMWARRLRGLSNEIPEPPVELGNPVRRPLVLLVDDEKLTRQIAFKVLEALGYGVLLAEDGIRGYSLAKQYHPDIVLTDEVMPRMDGKHLCKALKDDPETRHIPVIVMSGLFRGESQRAEILREYYADDCLAKPIPYERLGAVISGWLSPVACVV